MLPAENSIFKIICENFMCFHKLCQVPTHDPVQCLQFNDKINLLKSYTQLFANNK